MAGVGENESWLRSQDDSYVLVATEHLYLSISTPTLLLCLKPEEHVEC